MMAYVLADRYVSEVYVQPEHWAGDVADEWADYVKEYLEWEVHD